MKRLAKFGVLSSVLALAVWTCGHTYAEYRSITSTVDSFAQACKATHVQPCVSDLPKGY